MICICKRIQKEQKGTSMNFIISTKDAKIIYYSTKCHTAELIDKILKAYNDNSLDDSEKKDKIGRYATAAAIRNIKKSSPKAVASALKHRTFKLVEKIIKANNDSSLSTEEKREKINKYCLAIALRRGAIRTKNSNAKEE